MTYYWVDTWVKRKPENPPVKILGGNIPVILDEAGGADISGVVRQQINQPALTHGYFTWSQSKRQDIAAKTIAWQKYPTDTPRPKPNTAPSNKAKKQVTTALDGGQSASQEEVWQRVD